MFATAMMMVMLASAPGEFEPGGRPAPVLAEVDGPAAVDGPRAALQARLGSLDTDLFLVEQRRPSRGGPITAVVFGSLFSLLGTGGTLLFAELAAHPICLHFDFGNGGGACPEPGFSTGGAIALAVSVAVLVSGVILVAMGSRGLVLAKERDEDLDREAERLKDERRQLSPAPQALPPLPLSLSVTVARF